MFSNCLLQMLNLMLKAYNKLKDLPQQDGKMDVVTESIQSAGPIHSDSVDFIS